MHDDYLTIRIHLDPNFYQRSSKKKKTWARGKDGAERIALRVSGGGWFYMACFSWEGRVSGLDTTKINPESTTLLLRPGYE